MPVKWLADELIDHTEMRMAIDFRAKKNVKFFIFAENSSK